ncbi:MAG: hypothetical protein HYY18_08510 [Planctomycetes bacterium]|nr:hypothetical protein [Planctomycetota bacterium]
MARSREGSPPRPRAGRLGLALLAALAGCASPQPWTLPKDEARSQSTRTGRPMIVLSLLGDLTKRC